MLFLGPESEKDLPDIYALLESFEEDKVNLLNSQNIFDSEKQKAKYQYIDELKLQMADSTVEKYVDDFHQNVEDEILMIGSITLEDVQVNCMAIIFKLFSKRPSEVTYRYKARGFPTCDARDYHALTTVFHFL